MSLNCLLLIPSIIKEEKKKKEKKKERKVLNQYTGHSAIKTMKSFSLIACHWTIAWVDYDRVLISSKASC